MSLKEEELNFLRFYFLNLKIASKAVRVYFDSVHPAVGLATELANSSVTLKRLRFMTKLQLSILYPSPGQTVTSADFDTTLIMCLLRNLPPSESAPVTGWDNLPHPGDTSTGADLARVKWYRNQLVHSKDGILLSTDFNKCWGDLEGAIGRLSAKGRLPMLNEAQLAKLVSIGSLTDVLLELRNYEKSQQELTEMITNLQSAVDCLRNNQEEQEQKIHQVHVSHRKGPEAETQTLSTEPSDYKDKCKEKREACKNDIKKNEELIQQLQDQLNKKQDKIADLISRVCKLETHDKLLKEHDEHLAILVEQGSKQGEQIAQQGEQIAQHCEQMAQQSEQMAQQSEQMTQQSEQMAPQGGSNQTRLEEDTRALMEEDVREDTFVSTKAVTDGLLLLKQNGVLLITGYAGTGKSRIGRHVLHMFCTENKSLKCIKLTLAEWDNMTNKKEKKDNREENMNNRADNLVLLLDDIFGETNCIYNREKDTPVLDKVHAYVCKGNIKVIITIRDTVKRQCQEVFDSHRLFQFDSIDLSSDKYLLNPKEKNTILTKYMKTVHNSDFIERKGYADCNGDIILKNDEVLNITFENPVKGFPLVMYQFVHNDKYFKLGSTFFDRPTEAMLEEMNAIRRTGEDHRKFMIQYAVMVYTAINENCINPGDNTCVKEVLNIIDAIYGEKIEIKKCHILDAVKDLKGSYLVNIPSQGSFKLHHPTLQESVILSFALIDEENIDKIIPLISWSFFLKMVKPESYKEKEGEVVLRFPTNSYKLLADRLVDFYIAESRIHEYHRFIQNLCNTEIFRQDYSLLLPCLLEALEKEDDKDKHTENMINEMEYNEIGDSHLLHIKNTEYFFANLLITLAASESQLDIFNFALKTLKALIKTSSNPSTIGYMKSALISLSYEICATKDVRSVKATLDILEENNLPVLLDQGIRQTDMTDVHSRFLFGRDCENGACVFLTLGIWKAYEGVNTPVLQFLLSKYNQAQFDINLFFNMIYTDKWIHGGKQTVLGLPSLSFEPLKWMIETFKDQELIDPNFILRTACKYQMFDTVEYLASRCKTFDKVFCLQAFVDKPRRILWDVPFNQELFNFLKPIDTTSKELIPIVMSVIQEHGIPDYMSDAFLSVCINNTDILTLACQHGQVYLVKLIIESSNFAHLDIQSALKAACKESKIKSRLTFYFSNVDHVDVEVEILKIVIYILEKFGFEQIDLKVVCQQACSTKKFKIIDWFVQNVDTSRLDVYAILNSALDNKKTDILEQIVNKIDIDNLDKRENLKSYFEHYTTECSTIILESVSSIWHRTEDKEVLHMKEMVNIGYERKCFELLMWIHENCHPHVSIDLKKVLMLACEDCRLDVAKRVLQSFEQTSLDIDGGTLFMIACSEVFHLRYDFYMDTSKDRVVKFLGLLNWILATFQLKGSDVISGVIKLISVNIKIRNELDTFVFTLLEQYLSCLKTEDIKEMMNKSLDQKYYVLVNWFLKKRSSCSFDKQMILNKACKDAEIETIKILSKYLYALDMNKSLIIACTSAASGFDTGFNNDKPVACLSLLWKEMDKIDKNSIDIRTIVSTVCKKKIVRNNVMTWILLNLPLDQIPINEVLITCCQQSKIHHVKYIFHEVNNEKLYIKKAFVQACWAFPCSRPHFLICDPYTEVYETTENKSNLLMIVDYLFQMEDDKDSFLSLVVNELFERKKFELILYFLEAGYYRHIDMKKLLKDACRYGHFKLVQWILGNVEHKELDIKSAFHAAWDGLKNGTTDEFGKGLENGMCIAFMWHYIHDINMFEIDTVLKDISDPKSHMSELYPGMDISNSISEPKSFIRLLSFVPSNSIDALKTWLLYIKKMHQRICQPDKVLLNIQENINQQSQHVNDGQCCIEDLQDNNDSNSSNEQDDCPSPVKRLRSEIEEQK